MCKASDVRHTLWNNVNLFIICIVCLLEFISEVQGFRVIILSCSITLLCAKLIFITSYSFLTLCIASELKRLREIRNLKFRMLLRVYI